MDYREFSAKTLEEAITAATVELGVTSDHLDYCVIEKGSNGILGIGRKDVTIKAREKDFSVEEDVVEHEIKEDPIIEETEKIEKVQETSSTPQKDKLSTDEISNLAENFLSSVFKAMDVEAKETIEFSEDNNSLSIDIKGPSMGVLIGKRGQTLDALQYLTSLVINKHSEDYIRVKLDTEDYRNRRKETLENLAKNIAFKVKKTGESVKLEAMNPYERRTIHFALQGDDEITTLSEGEEPYRHVVVSLKK